MKKTLVIVLLTLPLLLSANADNSTTTFKAKWGISLDEFKKDCDILNELDKKRKSGSFNFEYLTNVKHSRDSQKFLALLKKYR